MWHISMEIQHNQLFLVLFVSLAHKHSINSLSLHHHLPESNTWTHLLTALQSCCGPVHASTILIYGSCCGWRRMGMKLDTFIQWQTSEKQCVYVETSLSVTCAHTLTLSNFGKEWLLLLMGTLNCLLACKMTPAAETSPQVIHCFNHSGSPTSSQPQQRLTHHCLLKAQAPFVLFRTLSLLL